MSNNNSQDFYTGVLQGGALVGVGDVLHDPIPLRNGQPYPYLRRRTPGQQEGRDAYYAISSTYLPGEPVIYRILETTFEGEDYELYNDSYEV